MDLSSYVENREPKFENAPLQFEVIELELALLRWIGGGDDGSGLIHIPK
jgi:hypothetical protein